MKIQYSHNRKETQAVDATLALEVPTKDFLQQMFTLHGNQTIFHMGIALKSPHDQFEKSIGRDIATQNMKLVPFTLTEIRQLGTKHLYNFRSSEIAHSHNQYFIRITLTTVAESDKVRFVSSFVMDVNL